MPPTHPWQQHLVMVQGFQQKQVPGQQRTTEQGQQTGPQKVQQVHEEDEFEDFDDHGEDS